MPFAFKKTNLNNIVPGLHVAFIHNTRLSHRDGKLLLSATEELIGNRCVCVEGFMQTEKRPLGPIDTQTAHVPMLFWGEIRGNTTCSDFPQAFNTATPICTKYQFHCCV